MSHLCYVYLQASQVCYCCLSLCRLRVPIGCTTELNPLGYQFLQRLFDKYDEVSSRFLAIPCYTIWIVTHTGMFSIRGFPCCQTWSLFPFRIRTLLCHQQSWRTYFVFVLTCHGVQRSTCLFRPQMRATSLIMATFVSGRKCVSRLLMTLWDHKHALSLHRYTLTGKFLYSHAGFLPTLTSTVAWSTSDT